MELACVTESLSNPSTFIMQNFPLLSWVFHLETSFFVTGGPSASLSSTYIVLLFISFTLLLGSLVIGTYQKYINSTISYLKACRSVTSTTSTVHAALLLASAPTCLSAPFQERQRFQLWKYPHLKGYYS